MKRALGSVTGALVVAVVAASCSESSVTLGGPLELTLTASSPVRVQDSVVVEFDVVGRQLIGLILDFADGSVDSIALSGAQSAAGRVAHQYGSAGNFLVTGRVQDAIEGDTMDDVSVTVVP